jgi:exodeoxyribonuclease III
MEDVSDVKAFLLALGYHHCAWYWCEAGSKLDHGYSGSAIFSRIGPIHIQFGFKSTNPKLLNEEGRVIIMTFEDFVLVASYSPCSVWGSAPDLRREAFDGEFKDHFVTLLGGIRPVILCDDINVTPTEADDNVDPTHVSSCKDFERKAFADTLAAGNLVDAYRWYNPTASAEDFTWARHRRAPADQPRTSRKQTLVMRIDHFTCSESMLEDSWESLKVTGCSVEHERVGSDHRAVILTLTTPAATLPATTIPANEPCQNDCSCTYVVNLGRTRRPSSQLFTTFESATQTITGLLIRMTSPGPLTTKTPMCVGLCPSTTQTTKVRNPMIINTILIFTTTSAC